MCFPTYQPYSIPRSSGLFYMYPSYQSLFFPFELRGIMEDVIGDRSPHVSLSIADNDFVSHPDVISEHDAAYKPLHTNESTQGTSRVQVRCEPQNRTYAF